MKNILLVLLIAPTLFASGWKKTYFGATPPGSWARYTTTAPEMTMTTTMTRLNDDDGSARIALEIVFANNQYPPVKNFYTLKRGFALDRQLIDYMSEIASGTIESSGVTTELDADTIMAIVKGSPKFEPASTFKGTEIVGGKQADHYVYVIPRGGDPAQTETGDLWLSDAVPFGIVKQTSVTKDTTGKITTRYEQVLVASGVKSVEAAKSAKAAPPKKSSQTLKEAYDAGLVEVTVTIDAASHNGERAHVIIEKKDDERITIIIPKGKTSLHVDVPLDDFMFEVAAEKKFEIGGNKAAELDVKQIGDRRAMEGHFQISTDEGTPLFSGSATVGSVK